ncbi:hypothetical protein [Streptomyces sp. NPDC060035]|uniref:hypothetical protein n=1 Tax=Streptomyces sp. NPDC060035 TaxID=3347044 RepID=UPI003699E155
MPDRLRTAFGHPLPERTFTLMRERQPSSPDSSSPTGSSSAPESSPPAGSSSAPDSSSTPDSSAPSDDNPFAAPPEDRPDQPWQPRHPSHAPGSSGNGGNGEGPSDDRPVWGSQWSDQQPGRQNGGFGSRPGGTGGQGSQGGGPEGSPGGLRWDPTDPAQRRARYAVLGGMWAFFFALFDFPEIALLLGALAVYWSVSALRAGPRKNPAQSATGAATAGMAPDRAPAPAPSGAAPATPPATAQNSSRQQTTAAVSGLVTALLALLIVATSFTVQLVYRDYYTCVNDALTKSGALACNDLLPEPLEPFFGVKK